MKYIVYTRKSTDEKDRQILSIEAQVAELTEFAKRENLEIVEFISEAKTAKIPCREKFDLVLKKIEEGEASGIISWHPDRLARNSIDGGKIIYLLDTGKLLDLKFPSHWFENTPQGKFMLSIAFSQSKYYIDNLSENVKRGLRQKLRNGVLPAKAPWGYKNNEELGIIEIDEVKSKILKKAFELFANGNKSFTDIALFPSVIGKSKLALSTSLLMGIVFAFFSFIFSPIAVLANNNADIVNSSISVSSTSIPADGSTTATISVTVQDSLKNLLAGDRITLTNTSKDSGLVINGGTIEANDFTSATDSNGKVTFTVSSRNISPGIDTFTITDISDVPPVTLGSVSILFTPSALAPNSSCSDGAPGSAPQLTSVIATGSQQITLTWTQAADPVSYYMIAYGITSGKYIYGNSNVGGRGTTSYTVSNLAKGTTYYFVVRAGNGCAPGGFSKELSATTLGVVVANIPTPTQMPATTSSNTNSQNSQPEEITPTFTPTNTPTPTLTPMLPTPTLIAGFSITKFLTYLFLCILILGGLGGFIYWKYKKETRNIEKPITNQLDNENSDSNNPHF